MKKFLMYMITMTAFVIIGIETYALFVYEKALDKSEKNTERYKIYYSALIKIFKNMKKNINMSEYLLKNGICNVAIYGKGTLGEVFYNEIKDSDVNIECFIDRNATNGGTYGEGIPVKSIEEFAESTSVDAIIISPIFEFESISEELLKNNISNKRISLEEIVYNYEYCRNEE